jgi:type I restriction enzyme S subunit
MMKHELARYDAYKDSGAEWIGEVPKHWDINRIKNHTYVKGRIGWQGLRNSDFLHEGDFYCVTGTDIKNGVIDWSNCYYIPENRYEQDKFIQLKVNDLLITKDGTIGKVALVYELPKKSTLNSGVFVTRPLRGIYTNEYMYWVLCSSMFRDYIDLNKGGATIQHLYQYVFERFSYPCPLLPEQKAIADYLYIKTAQIDRKIDLLTKKATLYGKLRQSLINETVTRGLDKTVAMKDSGIEWIGEVPAHWGMKRIKEISEINKRTLSDQTPASYEFNYIDIGSVTYGVKEIATERMTFDIAPSRAKRIVKKGDTIISTVRTYLKAIASIDDDVSDLIVSTDLLLSHPTKDIFISITRIY